MMLPRQFAWSLRREWLNCTKWLHGERHRLVEWDVHIDQVSWAFAMLRLGYPFDELSIDYNFPTGFASKIPPSQYRSPRVLHHHNDIDEAGAIRPTGIPAIDSAIERANGHLKSFAGTSMGAIPA